MGNFGRNIFIIFSLCLYLTIIISLDLLHFLQNILCLISLCLYTWPYRSFRLTNPILTLLFKRLFLCWPLRTITRQTGHCCTLTLFLFRGWLFAFSLNGMGWTNLGFVTTTGGACVSHVWRLCLGYLMGWYDWTNWRLEFVCLALSIWWIAH